VQKFKDIHCSQALGFLRLVAGYLKRPVCSAIIGTIDMPEDIMAHLILAETTASVSELKKNPMGTVAAGEGFPVAILNRNEPAFYCVPAKAYEALMDKLEDFELNAIADARLNDGQQFIKVSLDAL
jgi:antitoxin StbD